VLVSNVKGGDQNSLADVKSDVEALQEDLVEDLGTKRGQEIKRYHHYGNCPYGFTYLHAARSCYKVVFESHGWTSAIQKCNELRWGSHLATITSATENNAVKAFLAFEIRKNAGNTACIPSDLPDIGVAFWTSGQRIIENSCESPFVWKPSSDKKLLFEFTNWAPGEPNCHRKDQEGCMHIWANHNFGWNDIWCSAKICPLCEYKP
jgi:hypothetical protein